MTTEVKKKGFQTNSAPKHTRFATKTTLQKNVIFTRFQSQTRILLLLLFPENKSQSIPEKHYSQLSATIITIINMYEWGNSKCYLFDPISKFQ